MSSTLARAAGRAGGSVPGRATPRPRGARMAAHGKARRAARGVTGPRRSSPRSQLARGDPGSLIGRIAGMVPELRRAYNAAFTEAAYRAMVAELERDSGVAIDFRISE